MIILPKVSPEVSIAARRIHKFAWAIDCLIPKHRLSEQDISAAAATVELAARGYGKFLAKKFELGTTLRPGTEAYNRAEFRNVIFVLYKIACYFKGGKRAPALLALFWYKQSDGISPEEHTAYQRNFVNWRDHLHRRRQLVRKALDRRSALSERQRKSILRADPLIADILREIRPLLPKRSHL